MSEQNDDLYETLNVSKNATQSQIKASYRKLALRYHPDKQSDPEIKRKNSEIFCKIGNAYEVLGNPDSRNEYDRFGTVGGNSSNERHQQQHPRHRQQQHHDPFMSGGFFGGASPFMNDSFFSNSGFGRNSGHFHSNNFADPFEIFRNVFGSDFNNGFDDGIYENDGQDQFGSSNQSRQQTHPFFGNMMGGSSRRNGHDMMMMNSMMNLRSSFPSNMMNQGSSQSYSYSSSSSSFGGGSGGVRESVSTSTRIINGKRQTVTERTIVKPDGTVEKTTETSGDDDFHSALGYNGNEQRVNGGHILQDGHEGGHDSKKRRRNFSGSSGR
mmetsp:Transcript_4875/g.6314  ORF Transcript_4875/g.6314 Transcript_4875/m.6314 type:complete len:325 (-) Transcript_4875:276-1250(-)